MAGNAFKLKVEPEQLEFSGPFVETMTKELTLTNTSDVRLAYKVKCTDNAVFKIRPVCRTLDPGASDKISITRTLPEGKEPSRIQRIHVHHVDAEAPKSAKDAWTEKLNEGMMAFKTTHVDPAAADAAPAAEGEAAPAADAGAETPPADGEAAAADAPAAA